MGLSKDEHAELVRLISRQPKIDPTSYVNRRIKEIRDKQYIDEIKVLKKETNE